MWLFAARMIGVVVVGEEVLDGVGGGSFAALVVGVVVIEGLLMGESLGVVVGVGGGHVGGEVQFPEPTEPLPHRARFVVGVFVVVDVVGAGAVTDVWGRGLLSESECWSWLRVWQTASSNRNSWLSARGLASLLVLAIVSVWV